jgi:polysaccharide biosynthesis protein VpsQ
LKRWIPFVAWVGFVGGVIVCADTGHMRGFLGWVNSLPLGDKAGHLFLIGMTAHFLNFALGFRAWRIRRCSPQQGGLIVLAVITVEELSQIWIPLRTFDRGDLLANGLGVFLAELAARRIMARRGDRAALVRDSSD